jgi:hypothetical protein
MVHKLANGPSKAKIGALARAALLLAGLLTSWAWAADISIRSGEDADTVIMVGPNAEHGDPGIIRMESDPDNGTLLQAAPPRDVDNSHRPPDPLIIIPEIHIRGKK